MPRRSRAVPRARAWPRSRRGSAPRRPPRRAAGRARSAVRPLDGQTAIVTGGGKGLGRAVAEIMASAGASVVIASRNAPELDEVVLGIKRSGGKGLAWAPARPDRRPGHEPP